MVRRPIATVLLVLVHGCGCSGEKGSDAIADTSPDGFDASFDVVAYPDSLEGQVARHLASCRGVESGCHGSEPPPAGLRFGLGPESDLSALVNVRSTERPDWMRVRPFDPAHSWMLAKLRNQTDAGVEAAMPLGSSGDLEFAVTVEAWIEAGAPNGFADAGSGG